MNPIESPRVKVFRTGFGPRLCILLRCEGLALAAAKQHLEGLPWQPVLLVRDELLIASYPPELEAHLVSLHLWIPYGDTLLNRQKPCDRLVELEVEGFRLMGPRGTPASFCWQSLAVRIQL